MDYAARLEDLSFTRWDDDADLDEPDCLWPKGFGVFPKWLAEGISVKLHTRVVEVPVHTTSRQLHHNNTELTLRTRIRGTHHSSHSNSVSRSDTHQ